MLDNSLSCSQCYQNWEYNNKQLAMNNQQPKPFNPPCLKNNSCDVSWSQLPHFDPYINIWSKLNSSTTEKAGLGCKIADWCELKPSDLELIFELDTIYGQHQAEKRERDAENNRTRNLRR